MLGFVTPSVDHIKAMRFTVSIPSWIQGVKSEGESVVVS